MTAAVAAAPRRSGPARTGHGRSCLLRGSALLRIERWDARREGLLSEQALGRKLEARGYQVSSRTWPSLATLFGQPDPGGRVIAIVSGLVKITLGRESAILAEGDMVYLPPSAVARLDVVGFSSVRSLEAAGLGR